MNRKMAASYLIYLQIRQTHRRPNSPPRQTNWHISGHLYTGYTCLCNSSIRGTLSWIYLHSLNVNCPLFVWYVLKSELCVDKVYRTLIAVLRPSSRCRYNVLYSNKPRDEHHKGTAAAAEIVQRDMIYNCI